MTAGPAPFEIGEMAWEQYKGDGADLTGGMVVDVGIDDVHGPFVVAFVPNPTYPRTSHRKRVWIMLRVDGGKYSDPQQIGELRRLYTSDLAPAPPEGRLRDVTCMLGYADKLLLAASLCRPVDQKADLLAAHAALIEAVEEVRAAERERHEVAARQGAVV